ncbi:FecCD family ABC transporter permease [Micromonosporaceae bacterium Da 78-11]
MRTTSTVRVGALSLPIHRRALTVTVVLVAILLAVSAWTLTTGDFPVPLGDVVCAVFGDAPPAADFVVNTLRLPRLLTALLAGAALAEAGAVMQSISRNPLGSPDLIGFTQGAATGGIVTILVIGGGTLATSVGAAVGGIVTAVVILALVGRRGLHGFRLVLVGVGMSLVLGAVNAYLLTKAVLGDAQRVVAWQVGNVAGRGWPHVLLLTVVLAVLLPVVLAANRRLTMLELGEDTASSLGVPVLTAWLVPLCASVGLVAAATAMAGPIPFVALAGPHLARRLTRSPGPNVLPAAVMGALLTVASDFAAQHLLAVQLPVGIVTSVFGGLYLVWLLLVQRRTQKA